MKASVKIRDEQQSKNPLLRAKIPISIFGLPFTSGISARDPLDLNFSLRTGYASGPSLKLSYNPSATTNNHFSFSLKSGVGLFGSPFSSPLVMSAHFNLLGNHNPTFCVQIKPQFGDFFLKKTVLSASTSPSPSPSDDNDHSKENSGTQINSGSEGPFVWGDLSETRGGLFSGIAMMARTVLPVTKHAVVTSRWGVNFPSDFGGKKLPFLTLDKIGIERVEEKQEVKPKISSSSDVGDLEMLKSMCLLMSREVEALQKENREMRDSLEEIRRLGVSLRNPHRESDDLRRRNPMPSTVESSSEFERWRGKKNGSGEGGAREIKKPSGSEYTLENAVGEELKRAIKEASSN